MNDLSWEDLGKIFEGTFRADPREYSRSVRRAGGEDYENEIIYDVVNSSPALQYARQRLPNNLADTGVGRWLQDKLPDEYGKYVGKVPLGGLSSEEREAYSRARQADAALRDNTVEVGKVPLNGEEIPTGDNVRAAAAQAAGVVAADMATDGLRNIWWFLNAPQAIAQIAALSAIHNAGTEYSPGGRNVPLLKNRNFRMAATLPAVIGTSIAIGNAWRQPGYKETVPSEVDPTKTADPLAEIGSRYILGRSGSLLPYEEFVKERPDVSRQEYENYKAYLFGNSLPLKATLDGIQGPEVTFMGKSIPILTGVLPAVAAVMGARYGVRKAAANLAGKELRTGNATGGENLLKKAAELKARYSDAKRSGGRDDERSAEERQRQSDELYKEYSALQASNEAKILRNALLYSGGALTATALTGQTLESIRRAMKGNVRVEEEQQPTLQSASNQRLSG